MDEKSISVNLNNFTEEERKKYLELTEKGTRVNNKRNLPNKNDNYWFIEGSGVVAGTSWLNNSSDKGRFSFHNCFETRRQAEFELEKRKVICELEDYALEHNELIEFPSSHYCGLTRFSSYETCQNAINHVGGEARIIKYLFGVEQEGYKS